MPVQFDKQTLRNEVHALVRHGPLTCHQIAAALKLTRRSELELLDQVIEELITEGHCARRPDPMVGDVAEREQPVGIKPIHLFHPPRAS